MMFFTQMNQQLFIGLECTLFFFYFLFGVIFFVVYSFSVWLIVSLRCTAISTQCTILLLKCANFFFFFFFNIRFFQLFSTISLLLRSIVFILCIWYFSWEQNNLYGHLFTHFHYYYSYYCISQVYTNFYLVFNIFTQNETIYLPYLFLSFFMNVHTRFFSYLHYYYSYYCISQVYINFYSVYDTFTQMNKTMHIFIYLFIFFMNGPIFFSSLLHILYYYYYLLYQSSVRLFLRSVRYFDSAYQMTLWCASAW